MSSPLAYLFSHLPSQVSYKNEPLPFQEDCTLPSILYNSYGKIKILSNIENEELARENTNIFLALV